MVASDLEAYIEEGEYVEEPLSGLWRSQDMSLRNFLFERGGSLKRDLLHLGQLGCCHWRNENTAGHKEHIQDVREAETLERQCRYFREQLHKWRHLELDGKPPGAWDYSAAESLPWWDEALDLERVGTGLDGHGGVLRTVAQHEADLRGYVEEFDRFRSRFKEWYVRRQVLDEPQIQDLYGGGDRGTGVRVVAGVVRKEKYEVFLRLAQKRSKEKAILPRAGEGHAARLLPAPDCAALLGGRGSAADLAYDIFYTGSGFPEEWALFVSVNFTSDHVHQRIHQVCVGLEAKIAVLSDNPLIKVPAGTGALGNWALPRGAAELAQMREEADGMLTDCLRTMEQTRGRIAATLQSAARAITAWEQAACVHKAVAHTAGLMQAGPSYLQGSAWVPASRARDVTDALAASARRGGGAPSKCFPRTHLREGDNAQRPTYFETNKYTSTFQGIVDSYGTPRYKEVNPAVFTIVTFPWLFGVMYGDIGHGVLILAAALAMILLERSLCGVRNEIFQMIFGARYLVLGMGFFATYVGFLYNDCFALMLEYSPSRYQWTPGWDKMGWDTAKGTSALVSVADPVCRAGAGRCAADMAGPDGPTPFGFDVAWMETSNKIDVYNSFKEKNAVILGVTQMMVGILLKLANHGYFARRDVRHYKHIFFGFIPECLFLACTFGYMCFIIVYKWVTPPREGNTNLAVNLLETMTNFFLSPGSGPDVKPGAELYNGQKEVQLVLLLIALVCVLLMLFPIPYIEYRDQQRRERERRTRALGLGADAEEMRGLLPPAKPAPGAEAEADVDMQEVVIKQAIHCIEFVLGAVSNTASYLRLWALSLAHAQLSEVFWTFTFMLPFKVGGSLPLPVGAAVLFLGFGVWLSVTVCVLVCMEALSAFLHTLRLHWVEFQNKFYWADGVPFAPLDLNAQLDAAGLPQAPWAKEAGR